MVVCRAVKEVRVEMRIGNGLWLVVLVLLMCGCQAEERSVTLSADPVRSSDSELKVTVRSSGNFVPTQAPFTKLQLVRVDERTKLQAWIEKKPDEKELRIVSMPLTGVKEVYTVDRNGQKVRAIPHEATIPGPEDVDVMVGIHAYQLTSDGKSIDYIVVR